MILTFSCGCGNGGNSKPVAKASPTISVKSEKIVDDYIRDITTADKTYKNKNLAITGQVVNTGQYSNSQRFYIVTELKRVGGKTYYVQVDYPVKKVDEVNKLKLGDFVAAEGKCVGMVPQDDPTKVSVQIEVGEVATGDQTAEKPTTETATPAPAAQPVSNGKVMTLSADADYITPSISLKINKEAASTSICCSAIIKHNDKRLHRR